MRTTAVLAAGLMGLAGSALAGDNIAREGAGERRAELNGMELGAFDTGLIDGLSGWQNTESVTADQLDGKVVVLFTWANWYPTSLRALPIAQRVQERFGGEGVVVIGVHHPDEYAGVEQAISRRHLTFPIAHDTGALREALMVDQDPDFYVIDRAGQLRFADIETGSVMAAVAQLAGESRDEARALPQKLAQQAKQARTESRRGHRVSEAYIKALRAEVPFELPDAKAYQSIEWPEHGERQDLNAQDFQGKPLPEAQSFEKVTWLSEEPATKGKIVVIDFWATWCGPCKRAMPTLEGLQGSNEQSLAIIGVGGQNDPEANVRKYLNAHKKSYFNAYDGDQVIYKALEVRAIPHVVVMSTDGIIRWQGDPNNGDFPKVVEQLIATDPGVKARLAAREAYLARLREEG